MGKNITFSVDPHDLSNIVKLHLWVHALLSVQTKRNELPQVGGRCFSHLSRCRHRPGKCYVVIYASWKIPRSNDGIKTSRIEHLWKLITTAALAITFNKIHSESTIKLRLFIVVIYWWSMAMKVEATHNVFGSAASNGSVLWNWKGPVLLKQTFWVKKNAKKYEVSKLGPIWQ